MTKFYYLNIGELRVLIKRVSGTEYLICAWRGDGTTAWIERVDTRKGE